MEEEKLSEHIEKETNPENSLDSVQQQKIEENTGQRIKDSPTSPSEEAEEPENLTRAQRRKIKRKLFKEEKGLGREKKAKKKKVHTILLITLFLVIISTVIFYKINKGISTTNIIPTGETKEFNIIARQFSFSPSTIEVNRGDKVKLTVTSVDVTHGIAIPQYGVDEILRPNRAVNIEFIANKPGKFPLVCSVACGTGHTGMRSRLVVN